MIKQIIKMLWTQRRSNGWIYFELLIVFAALWTVLDALLVDACTYFSPLGYNIENTYRLKLSMLNNKAPGYVPDSLKTSTDGEDLMKLMEQIRHNSSVEEVCATYFSCPYSFGNSWTSILPAGQIDTSIIDTSKIREQSYQVRRVTLEYFKVFRVLDKHGKPIGPQLENVRNPIVISADLEKLFYNNKEGKGQKVIYNNDTEEKPIAAVCQPVRPSDYEISKPCFYDIMSGGALENWIKYFGVQQAELCVRMKKNMTDEDMNHFLEEMGERLIVNNLYVQGVKSFDSQRSDQLSYRERNMKIKLSLMVFMLVNVFFGIVGTFWLWTENRRNEIGLRMALGSSKHTLHWYMNMEGLCLFSLALPFVILFGANMAYFDIMDTVKLPLSLWRFVVAMGGAWLLLAGMISLGIWIPARKASKMKPAEALHYED